jgi:hypothetical protein
MKKPFFYSILIVSVILIGSLVFEVRGINNVKADYPARNHEATLGPLKERPVDLSKTMSDRKDRILVVSGIVKEAYKNKNNELVIYLKDSKIPMMLNCTLYNSDIQIKRPIRLGERIRLKGRFTEIGEEVFIDKCRILSRSKK